MPWEQKNWVPIAKHEPPGGNISWIEVVEDTGRPQGRAKFKRGISAPARRKFQVDFDSEGCLISDRGHERYYYVICDEIIGASEGEPTKICKVKWHETGTVHGQPWSESELIRELRKHNPEEHARYISLGETDAAS
jgi:hypothetical protein